MLHKVKIESIDTNPIGARVFIDKNEFKEFCDIWESIHIRDRA